MSNRHFQKKDRFPVRYEGLISDATLLVQIFSVNRLTQDNAKNQVAVSANGSVRVLEDWDVQEYPKFPENSKSYLRAEVLGWASAWPASRPRHLATVSC